MSLLARLRAGAGSFRRSKDDRVARRLAVAALLVAASACAGRGPSPQEAAGRDPAFTARGRRAVVATADPEASRAGLRMMERGGNVVDAFAAASFALSVTRPQSTGIGGGGFAVMSLRNAGGERREAAFDFRERATAAARPDMFAGEGAPPRASRVGALAVATPGLVAGVIEIHAAFGTLPRSVVMEAAIRLAEEGFPIYPGLVKTIEAVKDDLAANPESARIFLRGGRAPAAGEVLAQPDLARTLRLIAAEGRDAFYRGRIAEDMVREVRRLGGLLAREDLEGYRVLQRPVLRGAYRDFEILAMPPPSAGGVGMIEMLNMLSVAGPGAGEASEASRVHLLAEIMRRAYEDRGRFLGDPDFVAVPVARLTSREFAAERLGDFDPQRATVRGTSPGEEIGITSTTHISIMDAAGNAVAATETINFSFGSTVTVPGTGILLNNEMDDFASAPDVPNLYGLVGGSANAIAPGKTPLSSMSPTIVSRGGEPVLVVGSPGGSLIITASLQTVLNVVDRGMTLYEAVRAPRIHHQGVPDRLLYEPGAVDSATAAELERRGHRLSGLPVMGNVQAAMRLPDGELVGVSDPRAEGRPAAY